ncbi:MAG: hypothetical protein V3U54_11805 [Thermodesulfobacteriota bacterium]
MIEPKSEFEREVRKHCEEFGGIGNFHIHGDRAYTRRDDYYKHIGKSISELDRLTLPEKQRLTWALHKGPAFEAECIEERMTRLIEDSLKFGVGKLHTTVDVTHNTKFKSLEIAEKLKEKYKDRIDIKIGAYNPSGFKRKDLAPERFELFEEAARRADFIVALGEKDRAKNHIGERQHNVYTLNLAYKLGKPVHYHVGQENRPTDKGVETLLEDIALVQDIQLMVSPEEFPQIHMVHAISPSCKPRQEFEKIADNMQKRRVGLLCCPRAAISMLQDENYVTPIHNSIAKVWDFAIRGIPSSLGVDNLDDIYVPATSPDVYDDAEDLANYLRFYNPRILAKVLCGAGLDDFDKGTIKRALFDGTA